MTPIPHKSRGGLMLLLVCLGFMGSIRTSGAQGDLGIRHVVAPEINCQHGYTPWDLDGDADAEFDFFSDRVSFALIPQPRSHVIASAAHPPNINREVLPLQPPGEGGDCDYSPHIWIGSLDLSGFLGATRFGACTDLGCTGTFVGQVPEPSTWALLVRGSAAGWLVLRRHG